MKKSLFLLFALQLFCLVIIAQQWTNFNSDAGKFSIVFPSSPKEAVETKQSNNGPYTSHLFSANTTKDIFVVGWVDYDTSFHFNNKSEMLANRDNFVKSLQATLLETKDITFNGYPGIDFTANTSRIYINSRVIIVGRRPYQLIVV